MGANMFESDIKKRHHYDEKARVADCQGFGRYTIPCGRRVKLDEAGRALCKPHRRNHHVDPIDPPS